MQIVRSVLLAISACAVSWAITLARSNAPVQRLVSNVENYVKTHPQDANGYYTLGRIPYLAFAQHAKKLRYSGSTSARLARQSLRTPNHTDKQGAIHLAEALRLLKKALGLDPGNGPIVLSLRAGAVLDLLAPAAQVRFDLDGTGRVTSGRQLFGNVIWWMFWESGYQALAALDDDHDGWLQGRELAGLVLWFDRNQNGISDPGEVIPIEQAGVEALAARADGLATRLAPR